jgi:ABC-type multidrug transport system fused ATPase/permease subunit
MVPLPYVGRYKLLASASVGLMLVGTAVALLAPWPLAFLVDSVLGTKQAPEWIRNLVGPSPSRLILFTVFASIAIALLSQAVGVLESYTNTKLEQKVSLDFRSDLFEHCQGLSQAFLDERGTGMFMYQINFEAHNVGLIAAAIAPLLQSVLTIIGMFLITYTLAPTLALLALTVVPGIYYSTVFYARRIEPSVQHVRQLEGRSLQIVNDVFTLLRVVVAFNRQRDEWVRFREQGEDAVNARVRVTVAQTLFSLVVAVSTAAGVGLIIGFGSHSVLDHVLTVGELLIVIAYIHEIYTPLGTISTTLAGFQQAFAALRAARRILDTEPEIYDKPDAIELSDVRGDIKFEDVSFTYRSRDETLKHVSFDARAGQVVAVVGPTGAGKTTLVNLIARFYDPTDGQILIDGIPTCGVTQASLRQAVSIVPQEPLLFPESIAENIRYGKRGATFEEVVAAAEAANAHDFILKLPEGYDTQVGERGGRLSGGERQRICIARAFIKGAPILVLDEPTAAVDSRTESVILDALDRLMEGRTTLMVAHRLSTIRHSDLILVMNDGELVESGSHEELLQGNGLYRLLWQIQTGHGKVFALSAGSTAGEFDSGGHTADSVSGRHPGFAAVYQRIDDWRAAQEASRSREPAVSVPALSLEAHRSGGAPEGQANTASTTATHGAPQKPKIVILGMMTKIPVAGVVWQTMQYMVGFDRLGYDVYYVEAHAGAPSMLMSDGTDDGALRAASFIAEVMRGFGFADRWAYHALHDDGSCRGMTRSQLTQLYRSAALIVNLHGGTKPLSEHSETGRLIYLETDPVQLQIELAHDDPQAVAYLEAHSAFFSFGENIGNEDCGVPTSHRFHFHPTRQPVVSHFWLDEADAPADRFTTIGNWRQQWRDVEFNGETYRWSKHHEFLKVLDLPSLCEQRFELALASFELEDRRLLESHGWIVRPAMDFSMDVNRYRSYIKRSRGEFTVAKDQNVRLRSGWFSDRSATYLAAGRPVVTQETGFSRAVPTGEGLFSFTTAQEAAAAVEDINGNYEHHRRAARRIAREFFEYDVVLGDLLEKAGLLRRVGGPQPSEVNR